MRTRSLSRRAKSLLLCLTVALTGALALSHSPASHAQSQPEMNEKADRDFKSADVQLNEVYKKLSALIDKQSQAKLRTTERAWIAFRDAQSDLHADVMVRGGSMAPMDRSITATALTRTRTHELEAMLKDLQQR